MLMYSLKMQSRKNIKRQKAKIVMWPGLSSLTLNVSYMVLSIEYSFWYSGEDMKKPTACLTFLSTSFSSRSCEPMGGKSE